MKNLTMKLLVISICFAFIIPSIAISSAEDLNCLKITEKMNIEETSSVKKTYIIYRFGPDGSISPVKVEIEVNEAQDLGESMANKCEELFENDKEMQNLIEIELENLTFGFICKVKSHGKGFHYKSMVLEKITSRFVLFRLGLPRVSTVLHKPLIICRYAKDIGAKTKITQLFVKNDTVNKTMIVEGNHSVFAQNFIGYTTWIGRFSKSLLDLFPRAFAGYARIVICNKID